ncbi:MAG: ABC transporter ATP-binding protein/permease [Oscillospiraceae bacterium]|nr:ABC transporter ATP-binding protein/permease [Oscillospiraceae bacterium]
MKNKKEKKNKHNDIFMPPEIYAESPEKQAEREKRQAKYASYRNKRKNEEKPKSAKGTLLRLLSLMKPYVFKMSFVVAAACAGTLLSVYTPRLAGDVIDALSELINVKLAGQEMDFSISIFLTKFIYMFIIYLTSSVLSFIQIFILTGVTQKLVCGLREQVNAKTSRVPLKYFDGTAKGEILSKIMNDCDNISSSLQSNITTVATSTIQVIGVLYMMFKISPTLTMLPIGLVPLSAFIAYKISRKSKKWFKLHWDRLGELNGHIEEMYTGHNIVKIFNRQKKTTEEFNDIADDLYHVTKKANFISGMVSPFLHFVNQLGFVGLCYFGSKRIIKTANMSNAFSLGTLVSFFSYSSMFSSPINHIASIINSIQSTLASAERIFSLLDEEEEPADNPVHTIERSKGQVEFKDVSFRYIEEKPLIDSMNIKVETGQLVALVGPTGSGKTTFVNLLMRFYDVRRGGIMVDGIDIREISRHNLRSIFGMVLQDTWLFKGTIKANIAYGRDGASDEEIVEAAKAARIHDFIESLPDGYETELKEEGSNVSGGQRQLITIARAILADPAILILDEATSSVDTRTELQIQEAMKTLMKDRTNFIIAHRLSTIKNADNILVIRKGTIVEQGTHKGLMEYDSFYASLYNSQYMGGIPPEDPE